METRKTFLILTIILTSFSPIIAQTCDPNNNYGVSLGLNQCSPHQVKLNNTCVNCKASNCLLCSLLSQTECDVCATGYILDTLTRGQCVLPVNSTPVCTATTCACSVLQVNDNGVCKSCNVSNCLLCSIGKPNQCDVCKNGYILDTLTKSSCVPLINNQLVCTSATCSCKVFQVNDNGVCKNCTAKNCRLCSVGNPDQCDICSPGYIFDTLTGLTCVSASNSLPVCSSTSCQCSPFQSVVNGACQNCSVLGCKLCSATNNHQCDICNLAYTYNSTTKGCDPPICTGGKKWMGDKCSCTESTYQDINGECKKNINEPRLGLVLGLSIPFLAIAAVGLILTNIKVSRPVGPIEPNNHNPSIITLREDVPAQNNQIVKQASNEKVIFKPDEII